MLSLKATLKAIGESITTIKTALDGKATKYTGYGTPVTLTTSWYTIPSDGFIRADVYGSANVYIYILVKNKNASSGVEFWLCSPSSGSVGANNNIFPVFTGQQVKISQQSNASQSLARYYPFI